MLPADPFSTQARANPAGYGFVVVVFLRLRFRCIRFIRLKEAQDVLRKLSLRFSWHDECSFGPYNCPEFRYLTSTSTNKDSVGV